MTGTVTTSVIAITIAVIAAATIAGRSYICMAQPSTAIAA